MLSYIKDRITTMSLVNFVIQHLLPPRFRLIPVLLYIGGAVSKYKQFFNSGIAGCINRNGNITYLYLQPSMYNPNIEGWRGIHISFPCLGNKNNYRLVGKYLSEIGVFPLFMGKESNSLREIMLGYISEEADYPLDLEGKILEVDNEKYTIVLPTWGANMYYENSKAEPIEVENPCTETDVEETLFLKSDGGTVITINMRGFLEEIKELRKENGF